MEKIEQELLYKDEVYSIIGAAIEVHKELGPGFLEAVYHEALEIEFSLRKIPFISKQLIQIKFKETLLRKKIRSGFYLLFENIGRDKSAEQTYIG